MKEYRATVQKIFVNGPHGPYALTTCAELEAQTGFKDVTFSLDSQVWSESRFPEPGTEVLVGDVVRKKAGYRAYNARFVRPEDNGREVKLK